MHIVLMKHLYPAIVLMLGESKRYLGTETPASRLDTDRFIPIQRYFSHYKDTRIRGNN